MINVAINPVITSRVLLLNKQTASMTVVMNDRTTNGFVNSLLKPSKLLDTRTSTAQQEYTPVTLDLFKYQSDLSNVPIRNDCPPCCIKLLRDINYFRTITSVMGETFMDH